MQVVIDNLPAFSSNSGGRIRFGPDGMLYIGVGDAGRFENAQHLQSLHGKILRVTPDGRIPDDNPWRDSAVWALGFRNPLGLVFHPITDSLFVADAGQEGRDQIHIVQPGRNYGWPRVVGEAGLPEYEDPVLEWTSATPPGSLAFHAGTRAPEWKGDLFLTTLRSEALIRIRFENRGKPHLPTAIERWFVAEDLGGVIPGRGDSEFGRLRAVAIGVDGALYIGTSNRDQAYGRVRAGDDRIIRISLNSSYAK